MDSSGAFRKMDLMVQDLNDNNQYDLIEDRVFVGALTADDEWAGTVFILDFHQLSDIGDYPSQDDLYQVKFNRPFHTSDSLVFRIEPEVVLDVNKLKQSL